MGLLQAVPKTFSSCLLNGLGNFFGPCTCKITNFCSEPDEKKTLEQISLGSVKMDVLLRIQGQFFYKFQVSFVCMDKMKMNYQVPKSGLDLHYQSMTVQRWYL